ncbi:MAG TPA: aromatic amino acid lyase, partial [Kofleriaceae bacterium]|nr:aromatic amino acid lyase [Kofleriaceae bacterium]
MPKASEPVLLGQTPLSLEVIAEVARENRPVAPSATARAAMVRARAVVDAIADGGDEAPAVYGVNTGFGALAEVRISAAQIATLQRNLVRSHSVGVGEPLPREAVRAMMLLRAAVLSRGTSGARPAVCELLCAMLGASVHPEI